SVNFSILYYNYLPKPRMQERIIPQIWVWRSRKDLCPIQGVIFYKPAQPAYLPRRKLRAAKPACLPTTVYASPPSERAAWAPPTPIRRARFRASSWWLFATSTRDGGFARKNCGAIISLPPAIIGRYWRGRILTR